MGAGRSGKKGVWMAIVFEGLVSTLGPDGTRHLAPMGPRFANGEGDAFFELAPFQGSSTLANLLSHPWGVFHITDQVFFFVKSLLDQPQVDWLPADVIQGWIIGGACRTLEFQVIASDLSAQRSRLTCQVVNRKHLREMGAFNRARHAIIEGAILYSRRHLLNPVDLADQFARLVPLVEKTGGEDEKTAFELLRNVLGLGKNDQAVDRS